MVFLEIVAGVFVGLCLYRMRLLILAIAFGLLLVIAAHPAGVLWMMVFFRCADVQCTRPSASNGRPMTYRTQAECVRAIPAITRLDPATHAVCVSVKAGGR
jgi:hypothetical protein